MKITTTTRLACLIAALAHGITASPHVDGPAPRQPARQDIPREAPVLEARQQAQVAPAGLTTAESQYPTVTTQFFPSTIPGVATTVWAKDVYTQTFAAVPDQLPSPGSGSIGYGTLKHNKRDQSPVETSLAGRVRI